MKVLKLTTLLDFGGQEVKFLSLTENPEELHHEYVFAAIGYGGHAEKVLRERGFEVHILNRNFRIRNLSNIPALYRFIKTIKPDLIHTAAAEANFIGIIAAKLAGVPHIVGEEIGIPNHSPKARIAFRKVYKLADKVVCISQAVKDFLVDIKEIEPAKGVVMYNPVSIPKAVQKTLKEDFEIVYAGRLDWIKNVDGLIRAVAIIKDEAFHLTIVGDGVEMDNLKALVEDCGISDKITFTGFSSHPEEYVSQADLFVMPSHSEGFGIAIVEAMFQKIPVLGTNVGGIPEFLKDRVNGWLFDPKRDKELAEKIRQVIHMEEAKRNAIGKQGYKDVFERFTVEKYVEDLERLYQSFNSKS